MPTTPAGKDEVVTLSPGGLIVNVSEAVADCDALSVTRTVNVLAPAAVGVPEIVPPAENASPAGNVPPASDHV